LFDQTRDDVIRFVARYFQKRYSKLTYQMFSGIDLSFEFVWHGGSVSFVFFESDVSKCLDRSISHDDEIISLGGDDITDHPDESVDRLDLVALTIGQLGEAVIRSI
jgi:hypothetical protein